MSKFGFFLAKVKYRLKGRDKEEISKYFRKRGMNIGKNTKISTNIETSEPYLIEIGDNVTFSHDVDLITHDNSVCKIFGVDHDLYGPIVIGDNCFIGAHAIIMYGVTLPENTIVAAGSVVTKSPKESNTIIGGNPAKEIGKCSDFKKKNESKEIHAGHLDFQSKKTKIMSHKERWIKR